MAAHHYVPRYILKHWATDGLLAGYSWHAKARRSVANRVTIPEACSREELNALRTVADDKRYDAETSFTKIDTPAARALTTMLDAGVPALTPANRRAWAKFINSLPVRMPETLLHLGPEAFRRAVEVHKHDKDGPEWVRPYVTARFLERVAEHALDAPVRAAMDLSMREDNVDTIATMAWWTRRFEGSRVLMGDRPLLTAPRQPWPCGIPIDNPHAVLVFPLSPSVIWYASANVKSRTISRRQSSEVALLKANRETIQRSAQRVFAKTPAADFRSWIMAEIDRRGEPAPLPPIRW
ncbi:DUF4238 domain-containing protein [Lichenibacterium ramalinae]|uniref:DUF4238 domain-containing protein n=1 Tax=Lichenibacterium ramalinae TaxID=2316527 RepID=A0A4Q2RHZ4_9HYPH|nr:DUF4238 domain-containing protein [Lichenibacterium ramalinae]RYB05738.1 DUF4238 domain-containing protein [Lichenibacterium ramalinae]